MPKISYAVVLCARMESGRFPGKVLASYCPDGTPNLLQIVQRWRRGMIPGGRLLVATTSRRADDAIVECCRTAGVICYQGNATNVVARMDYALRCWYPGPTPRYVIRALADNPLVHVGLAMSRLRLLARTGADATWYGGLEALLTYAATTDVYSRAAWDQIVAHSCLPHDVEHPGLWLWRHMAAARWVRSPLPPPLFRLPVRTELDTPADLAFFRAVWQGCRPRSAQWLPTAEALRYVQQHPGIMALNTQVPLKTQAGPGGLQGVDDV